MLVDGTTTASESVTPTFKEASASLYSGTNPKRRRFLPGQRQEPARYTNTLPALDRMSKLQMADVHTSHGIENEDHRGNVRWPEISISSTSKLAGQTVAPFLARHIPEQYAPLGVQSQIGNSPNKSTNSKYCYRHRPDLKCRRQADEPSMEQLQLGLETLSQADQQGIAHVWSLFSAAPSKQRNLMLQGILTQCCFPQLSFISAAVRDLIRIDFVAALPAELSFKILCYLDTTSLCKASQVNQRWRILADDDVVWHKMCEQHIDRKCTKCGWGLPLLERKRLRACKRQIQLRATGRGLNEWSPDITPFPETSQPSIPLIHTPSNVSMRAVMAESLNSNGKREVAAYNTGLFSPEASMKRPCTKLESEGSIGSYFEPRLRPWKDVYKDRFKVGTNWKYGRCSTKLFRGHTNGVMCLQFDDNILATGSYDATIKIWDIDSGEELRTLRGHGSGIRCLQFDDTKLISGSMDRSLKVWNWRTGDCISTYTGHSGGIISLHFDSTLLASGSMDKTVKIWNFEDKSTVLLRGHTDWVNAVKLDSASRTVFSASDDCTVRLWDLDTRTCIKVFEGHVGQVQQVLPLPPEFEFEPDGPDMSDGDGASSSGGMDDTVELSTCGTENGPAFSINFGDGRPSPPRYMLTGALDSTIRLWEVSSGRCLRTFFGHVEGVWALAADTLRVVSGAEDRMVKVWDTRTGRCERTFTGHAGPVTCIGLSDSRMCTGGEDCEVRLYSFGTGSAPNFLGDPPSPPTSGELSSSVNDGDL